MSVKSKWLDIVFFIIGAALLAVSVSSFSAPNKIAAGGLIGLATIIHSLTTLPVGVGVLIMNIPIFIAAYKKFGMKFLYASLAATVLMSVFIDLSAWLIPAYTNDKLLACIFGGVFSGTGVAMFFLRGATTGGVDIIAKIINSKYPHISIGNTILMADAVVVALSAVVYGKIENALYAAIFIFVQSRLIDALIYGSDKGRIMLINSKNHAEIADRIMKEMHRGVTVLSSSGAYTHSESRMLMCAVRRYEAAGLHRIVKTADKHAFVVTLEAGEIIGEGFGGYSE